MVFNFSDKLFWMISPRFKPLFWSKWNQVKDTQRCFRLDWMRFKLDGYAGPECLVCQLAAAQIAFFDLVRMTFFKTRT